MKKSALGRGLDALFPQDSFEGEVRQVSLDLLDPNPDQPRKDFDEDSLNELAASIAQLGLLQPILASPHKGRYRIIAGERRFRAAIKAGLQTVPVLIRTLEDHQRALAALTEHLQRRDLPPMEAAFAIRRLMDEGSLTQEEAAKQLGKSRPALANLLRLLQLSPAVQEMVQAGQLSEGHARVLAAFGQANQLQLAQQVIRDGLSVRALESLSRRQPAKKHKAQPSQLPELTEFQDRLTQAVGVRASVKGTLNKGRIVLPYASYEELESIYEAISRLLD